MNVSLIQKLSQHVLEIRQELAARVALGGCSPHPELNAIFHRLINIVQTPLAPEEAAKVIQQLSTPQNLPALQHLRQLCWDCEMAMERETATKVINDLKATATPLSEGSSTQDKIRHFEAIAQRHYPHPWGGLREASNIQAMLELTATNPADTLFYGTSALPYSRLYWVWAAGLEGRSLSMTSVDTEASSRETGQVFISLMEQLGLVPPQALSLVKDVPQPVSRYRAAHVIQYPQAEQKEDILINLLNSGITKVSFTYPEGLVQLLYAPVNMEKVLSATHARPTGCLLSTFAEAPYFPDVSTLKPAENDALWLSTYVLEKAT